MKFATIGAGPIGQAIAGHLVAAGHEVLLSNRRGPDSLAALIADLGPLASAGTVREAAAAEMVFLAVKWPDIPSALAELPDWDARILVDTTNQLSFDGDNVQPVDTQQTYGIPTGSEVVASWAPGARVVKAFNTLRAEQIASDPRHEEGRQILFYAGDDTEAKATFAEVFDAIGFAPVDTGSLGDGGRLMQVTGGFLSGLHALKQD